RAPVPSFEVFHQRVEHFRHVAIAQVPRRDVFHEHLPVVLLGVLHQAGVLDGVEEVVIGTAANTLRLGGGPAAVFSRAFLNSCNAMGVLLSGVWTQMPCNRPWPRGADVRWLAHRQWMFSHFYTDFPRRGLEVKDSHPLV